MKKEYKKPLIIVESFGLSQSIAAGCGFDTTNPSDFGQPTYQSKTTCGWLVPDDFGDGPQEYWISQEICDNTIPEEVNMNGLCYNNPNGGVTIFGSV